MSNKLYRYPIPVMRMNYLLWNELAGIKRISTSDIALVVQDPKFIEAIGKTRIMLGLQKVYPRSRDETDIEEWIIEQLSILHKCSCPKGSKEWMRHEYQLLFRVHRVMYEANLDLGWIDFIVAFMGLNGQPKKIHPLPPHKISIRKISEDQNSIILKLDKGLSSEEYRQAWKFFKKFLIKPTTKKITSTSIKNRIYLDHQAGMSYSKLAQKYYPREFENDRSNQTDYSRDKVKKIVQRFRTSEIPGDIKNENLSSDLNALSDK